MSTDTEDLDAASVDHLLSVAKTKSDLQELVRMLHTRNLRLQRVRDRLALELHQNRP